MAEAHPLLALLPASPACWPHLPLSGKARDSTGKLQQRYPDVRGLLEVGSVRAKLWATVHSSGRGTGFDPDREGRVITELRKLQDQVKAQEVDAAEMEQEGEQPLTSDSEAEEY